MSPPEPPPDLLPYGDAGLLVRFGRGDGEDVHRRVWAALQALRAAGHAAVRDLHPAYSSILVELEPRIWRPEEVEPEIRRILETAGEVSLPEHRIHVLPVRYGGPDGPDLEDVARRCGLSPEEVVRRHAGVPYRVAFLGFAPGFPYLLGLPPELATPRRASPRVRVPAGSVAIAGSQAGIYPFAGPGGWRILGRTDAVLFDPSRTPAPLLAPGDRVRFVPGGGA